jgi:hypothetical protein
MVAENHLLELRNSSRRPVPGISEWYLEILKPSRGEIKTTTIFINSCYGLHPAQVFLLYDSLYMLQNVYYFYLTDL